MYDLNNIVELLYCTSLFGPINMPVKAFDYIFDKYKKYLWSLPEIW